LKKQNAQRGSILVKAKEENHEQRSAVRSHRTNSQ
jgi:hypothetical protein